MPARCPHGILTDMARLIFEKTVLQIKSFDKKDPEDLF